ncbi:hypothetical protein BDV95DRAFT_652543 [Massariosphaeria phaeospora]|uniref:CCR4-NOT transcription complex subunit 11 n=1 Tax=Massariosphaeria phaeospora TaxID=100035 RepID=A0A7C8HYV6_9PLEO|nr:hypothetical protein BDV95DRAFT_652543 [Massariosphaeria phaeospora]
MDITAALTDDEIAVLADSERACEAATRSLEHIRAGNAIKAGAFTSFEESLRVKNTLDAFEAHANEQASWETLAVLVNCEYALYALNQDTPLRNNPFLSHWVEAIQRLSSGARAAQAVDGQVRRNGTGPLREEINVVRVGFIKALLLGSADTDQFVRLSPRQLHKTFVESGYAPGFEIGMYVRMLEEEGIYEGTPAPQRAAEPDRKDTSSSAPPRPKPKPSDSQHWKRDLLLRLQHDPAAAIPDLTHLPLELSSLDFLTTLLQDATLQRLSLDPAPLISDYIQHALRLTEAMGQPPPPAGSSSPSASTASSSSVSDEDLDHGREAQTRAVKLLLLFMRNLVRKALLPPQALYFEIQEVCVRYVWIGEVREFRAWVEEGGRGDGDGEI